MNQFGFGADESPKDKRTIKAPTTKVSFLTSGGQEYNPGDIENQSKVGICTAIHLTQNRRKANGRIYSADFQYLLQKKYFDKNWVEGSSIFSALKVGYKYGFLPLSHWSYTSQADRELPYLQYIEKLKAIPDSEVERLIGLCVDKIPGYAQVNNNPADIAQAIMESEAGVLCRYEVGVEWFTPDWLEANINPLKGPKVVLSGHAIGASKFDFTKGFKFTLPNTWSSKWCRNGSADAFWETYRPTEVWTITRQPVVSKFDTDLRFGMRSDKVQNLQTALKVKGFFTGETTTFFGLVTLASVRAYQKARGISATGYVGPLTRAALNKDFSL